MKKLLKILGLILGLIVLAIAGTAAWVGLTDYPTFEAKELEIELPTDSISLANGAKIARTICGYCHMGEDGKFSGKLFASESEGFGEIWTGNITNHPTAGLGRYTNGEIAYLLRTGIKRDGKMVGPFMLFPYISDSDVASVIAFLRSDAPEVEASDAVRTTNYSFLVKALVKFGVFAPLEYDGAPRPMPDTSNLVDYGEYLATRRYECSSCHSENFETYNVIDPEKSPGFFAGGNPIDDPDFVKYPSRNITPHPEFGIGSWNEEQFRKAIKGGIRPDGTALSLAMPRLALLDDSEVSAIWVYLQTLPASDNNPFAVKED